MHNTEIETSETKGLKHRVAYRLEETETGGTREIPVLISDISYCDSNRYEYWVYGYRYIEGKLERDGYLRVHPVFPDFRRKHWALNPRQEFNGRIAGYHPESDLHLLAKEALKTSVKSIMLPDWRYTVGEMIDPYLIEFDNFNVSSVETEVKMTTPSGESVRLDALVTNTEGEQLGIEIYVSHRVDKAKIDKLSKIGIPTLEIDISDFDTDNEGLSDLAWLIEHAGNNQKWWLYRPPLNMVLLEYRHRPTPTNKDNGYSVYTKSTLNKLSLCPHYDRLIQDLNSDKCRSGTSYYIDRKDCINCERLCRITRSKNWLVCNQDSCSYIKEISTLHK